jgi:phenylacetate-CoA ligase
MKPFKDSILLALDALRVRLTDNFFSRLVASLFPKAWLLEGKARQGGQERVVFFGDPTGFNYVAQLFFETLPSYQPLGRVALWNRKALCRRREACAFFGEMEGRLALAFAKRAGYCLPEFLDAVLDLSGEDLTSLERHAVVERTRKRVEKNGWTMRVSRDPADFDAFYRSYYIPSAQRKFAHYRYVMPEAAMRRLYARGFFVQVWHQKTMLGAFLVHQRGKTLFLDYGGVLNGAEELVNDGVTAACYFFALLYALDNKLSDMDLGRCRPFLSDGVFLHKMRWGVGFHAKSSFTRMYWFLPDLSSPAARNFLRKNPFIHRFDGGLERLFSYDSEAVQRKKFIDQCRASHRLDDGLKTRFFPLPSLKKPAGPSDARRPFELAPALSGPALRFLSGARNRLLRRGYVEHYEKTPWMSAEELAAYQQEKLIRILAHARKTVPRFRKPLEAFSPSNFDMRFFRQIPLMDRKEMAASPESYRTDSDLAVSVKIATSGTTSAPVIFWVDGESIKKREAVRWRGRGWWGLLRGDAYAKFWGRYSAPNFRKRLKDEWLENAIVFNGYQLSPESLEKNYRRFMSSSSRYVYSYAALIFEIATRWRERGWFVPPGKIEGIIITAEMISPDQEQVVETIFGAPVIHEYGSSEFLEMAMECPHGGYHINADRLLMEFINEQGRPAKPFELGRIVVTDLDNLATPLIRYPIGDLGSYSDKPCTCGMSLPLLHELSGRESLFLEMSDGTRVHSGFFSKVMEDAYADAGLPLLPWHATQKVLNEVEFALTEPHRQLGLERAIQKAIDVLHPTLKATYRYVDVIPWTPNGKRTRFSSELKKTEAPVPSPVRS